MASAETGKPLQRTAAGRDRRRIRSSSGNVGHHQRARRQRQRGHHQQLAQDLALDAPAVAPFARRRPISRGALGDVLPDHAGQPEAPPSASGTRPSCPITSERLALVLQRSAGAARSSASTSNGPVARHRLQRVDQRLLEGRGGARAQLDQQVVAAASARARARDAAGGTGSSAGRGARRRWRKSRDHADHPRGGVRVSPSGAQSGAMSRPIGFCVAEEVPRQPLVDHHRPVGGAVVLLAEPAAARPAPAQHGRQCRRSPVARARSGAASRR